MTTPAYTYFVCPNGHGPAPFASARFCSQCGATLVPTAPPGQPVPISGNGWPAQPYPPQPPQQFAPPAWPQPADVPAPVVIGTPGAAPVICGTCASDGSRLDPNVVVCPQCRWLRPLSPGYVVHQSAFQWGADGAAMAKLRSFAPLTAVARAVSDKVGRRWVETSFNAVRIGENQLSDVYATAVRAARLLGMPSMPDVYVSGDKMWDAVTYGSDRNSFVLMGTSLINNYKGDDLLFLFAREMGHCRTGHALWKTVGMFLIGQQHQPKGMMSDGILGALNVDNLIQGAVEVPLLAWARQAEITADRAGLLAVGSEEIVRRVLLSWSLRSLPLFGQINVDAWLQQQQEDSEDQWTRFAELVSSPTPFITRRLKLLGKFAGSPELAQMRSVISALDSGTREAAKPAARLAGGQIAATPPPPVSGGAERNEPGRVPEAPALPADDVGRVACPQCGTGMRFDRAAVRGKDEFKVRCPNGECASVVTVRQPSVAAPPQTG